MEQAEITMIANLHKNTGKTLDEWIEIVQQKNFVKHGEIMKYLKDDYAFTHGFANLVALKAKKSDANSIEDPTLLINKQFKGKEHFIPIYDELIEQILKLGKDIEVLPKNNYVSLKRKKQFATLQAATKTRFEICLTIKGQEAEGDDLDSRRLRSTSGDGDPNFNDEPNARRTRRVR